MTTPGGLQRYFWMRTTGFPFGWLDEMRAPGSAARAREVCAIEAELAGLAETLRGEIAAKFPAGHDKLTRGVQNRAKLPDGPLPGSQAVARWNERVAELTAARATLEAEHTPELNRARQALHARLGDDKLREAVFLSARQALVMLDSLRQEGVGKRASKTRYREVEGFLFLQRFCAKNETVSFFGPIGWGSTDGGAGAEAMRFDPPTGKPARRLVSFEHWAANALAQAISRDEALKDDLPVRLNPTCRMDGDVLSYPVAQSRTLEQDLAKVARAARGQSYRQLVRELTDEGVAQAEALAAPLFGSKILERGLFVPTMVVQPEERVRQALEAMPPSEARNAWLERMAQLVRLREAYATASLEERAQLLMQLDSAFQDATGQEASRGEGQMYVGRTLLYEDCFMDGTLVLGRAATRRIEDALGKTVEICRWIVRDVAGTVHARYLEIFRGLGKSEVDLVAFGRAARALESEPGLVDATRERLARAWGDRLNHPEREEVVLGAADFDAVLAALPEPPREARFFGDSVHSPDVMLGARSREALVAGDFEVILGEIHKMVYYEVHPVGWPFCPDQADVLQRLGKLMPELPRVMDAPALHTSRGYHLPAGSVLDVVGPGTAARRPDRAAPISELVVAEEDGVLVVRHLRSSVRAPLLSVMQNLLYHWCDQVPPLPHVTAGYAPRVRFGPAVLRRRQWLFEAAELGELTEAATVPAAMIAAARLQAKHGLPARLFVKSPEEPKPVYVDLESPLSVELFIKLARKAPRLRASELYPDENNLWLEVGGRLHTSELRFTYVLSP